MKDAKAIAIIHMHSGQKAYEDYISDSILNEVSVSERTRQWHDLIKGGLNTLVVEADNRIIGFTTFCEFRDETEDNSLGEISAIYLLPEYWHQNFGTELCTFALNELSKLDYKEALVWVLADSEPARTFYESLGFQQTLETKLEEISTDESLVKVLYKKTL
jgi:ribosomal protein S18 acetylase RimI-like enzyme